MFTVFWKMFNVASEKEDKFNASFIDIKDM